MSISYFCRKIKGFGSNMLFLYIFILILVSIGSFILGRMSINKLDNKNVYIVNTKDTPKRSYAYEQDAKTEHSYVASKNGKIYYRIGCGASQRILEENKVYFASENEARDSGYTASSVCTP